MIGLSENPSDSLQCQSVHHSSQIGSFLALEDFEAIISAGLFGLIECLHDDSDTTLIVWVFSIVTVEKGNTLLLVFAGDPILDEVLNLCDVHELHVIDMTVLLPFDDHIGRNTFVTHSFGVSFMVLTGAIDLIAHS